MRCRWLLIVFVLSCFRVGVAVSSTPHALVFRRVDKAWKTARGCLKRAREDKKDQKQRLIVSVWCFGQVPAANVNQGQHRQQEGVRQHESPGEISEWGGVGLGRIHFGQHSARRVEHLTHKVTGIWQLSSRPCLAERQDLEKVPERSRYLRRPWLSRHNHITRTDDSLRVQPRFDDQHASEWGTERLRCSLGLSVMQCSMRWKLWLNSGLSFPKRVRLCPIDIPLQSELHVRC